MDKRIELEMRGRPANEVVELNLDNCRSTQIVGLTSDFVNLEHLSLINVGLTSLKGFPKLPSLKQLEMSDNRLTSGLENLSGCPNLKMLNLSGNKVKDVKTLEPLKNLKNLKSLDLFNCDITSVETYRQQTFETLPQLKFLDGFDREDREAEETDESLVDEDELDEEVEDELDEDDDDSSDSDEEVTEEDDEETGDLDDEDDVEEVPASGAVTNGNHKVKEEENPAAAGRGMKRKHEGEDAE